MTDIFSPEQRRALMARVSRRDTKPEWILRSALHRLGFRYRVEPSGLPGRPDLVFPRFRTVVFVHGCFWHSHANCRRATVPATNRDFWREKLARTVERDAENAGKLRASGWRVLIVWECELYADPLGVVQRLVGELTDGANASVDYRDRMKQLSRDELLGVAEAKVRYRLGTPTLAGTNRKPDERDQ